jgi:AcrR family transcriptional regulator
MMAGDGNGSARSMAGDQRLGLILSTAEKMFFEKGYRGVSIRDLAAAVGIQMSSLYYYFQSKDKILSRIIIRHVEELLSTVHQALDSIPAGAGTTVRLQTLIHDSVRYLLDDRLAAGISTSQARELPIEQLRELNRLISEYEDLYRGLIREGMESGEFIAGDVTLAAYIILGAQVRLSAWFRPSGRLSAKQVAETYSVLLLRSLGAQPVTQVEVRSEA